MYENLRREEISQGDIFTDIPIAYVSSTPDSSNMETRVEYVKAMMLTYSCDYDKTNSHYVIFAQIKPMEGLDKGSQGHIRKGKVRNAFHLPAIEGVMEESYVDFRRIDRVNKPAVKYLAEQGNRLGSLNDEAVLALQFSIAVFFGVERSV